MFKKLFRTLTAGYDRPSASLTVASAMGQRRPPFIPKYHVPLMMLEPRVCLAMWVIKGTIISNTRFYVECDEGDDSPVKKYLIKQLTRLWLTSASTILEALDYGYVGAEVLYRPHHQYQFLISGMRSLGTHEVFPVLLHGKRVGIKCRMRERDDPGGEQTPLYIPGIKSFWHVHWRQHDEWFGRSRLFGAFSPWMDLAGSLGARDIARTYYHKHAYPGRGCYHPPGATEVDQIRTPNRDIAREMLQKMRAGSDVTLPAEYDPMGNKLWEIFPLEAIEGGADVREWVYDLKDEILEGVGVMPEVIEAAETGSGYSGRKIPQEAFKGLLHEVVFWMLEDIDTQLLRPAVKAEFGEAACDYSIVPFGFVEDESGQDKMVSLDGKQPPPGAQQAAKSGKITS